MNQILILHGWGSRAARWQKVKELLEAKGLKVFVPDLPGFGQNPPPAAAWNIDDYVEWVKKFCEKNNLSRFFLLGHSFGGRVAIKFSVKYPEKLQGLILAAAGGVTERKTIKNSLFKTVAKTGKRVFSLPGLNLFLPLSRRAVYKLAGVHDYYVAQGTMKETMEKVISEDLKLFLPKIKIPTLIVWGKNDKETPVKDAYLLNKEITGSKLEIIPGVGHRLWVECPEKLVGIIRQWIFS